MRDWVFYIWVSYFIFGEWFYPGWPEPRHIVLHLTISFLSFLPPHSQPGLYTFTLLCSCRERYQVAYSVASNYIGIQFWIRFFAQIVDYLVSAVHKIDYCLYLQCLCWRRTHKNEIKPKSNLYIMILFIYKIWAYVLKYGMLRLGTVKMKPHSCPEPWNLWAEF